MSLRTRVFLVFLLMTALLAVALSAVSYFILTSQLSSLETQAVRKDVQRGLKSFDSALAQLATLLHDWSAWDDTYAFVEDKNEQYVRSNLTDSTCKNIRIHCMVFLNPAAEIVYAQCYDPGWGKPVPLPPELALELSPASPLLDLPEPRSCRTGVLMLPRGPMLVAARPILTSEERGPARGAILMGRYLDEAEVRALADLAQLDLTVIPLDRGVLPPDVSKAVAPLGGDGITVDLPGRDLVAGYAAIRDAHGKPGLCLRVTQPRTLYHKGLETALYLLAAFLAANIGFCVFLLVFLERRLLRRLLGLNQEVSRIGAEASLGSRLPAGEPDEIGRLGATINAMLEALEVSQQRAQASEEQSRRLADAAHLSLSELQGLLHALPDLYFRLERDGTILDYHAGQQADLYAPPEAFLGRRIREVLPEEVSRRFEEGVRVLDGGEPVATYEYALATGGTENQFECRLSGLPNRQVIAVVRNITARRASEKALALRERYLEALVEIQAKLLASHYDPQESGEVLSVMGEAARAHRVVLYQSRQDSQGRPLLARQSTWSPEGGQAPPDELAPPFFPYGDLPSGARAALEAGRLYTASVPYLDEDEREHWGRRAIHSVLLLPLTVQGGMWGAIQVEDQTTGRAWEASETALLTSIAAALSMALERRVMEEALLEGEQQFRTLAETATSGILICRNEKIIYANPAAETLSGFSQTELRQRSFLDFVHPQHRGTVGGRVAARLRGEKVPDHYEFNILRKDGRERRVDATSGYAQFKGEPAVVVTLTDITESRRATEIQASAYRISEAVLATENLQELYQVIHRIVSGLMDARNFFIALYDAETDWITFPYFVDEHDSAFPPQKAGHGLTEWVLRSGRPLLATRREIERMMESGEVHRRGTPATDWLGVPLKSRDRVIGIVAVQTYSEGVTHTERDKNILQFVSTQIAMAIQRKRSEDELRQSERRFREMLESVQVLSVILDTNGRVVFCNEFFLELTDYDKEDATGRDWFYSFIPSDQREELRRFFFENLRAGTVPPRHENEILTRPGERRLISWSNSVLKDPLGVVQGTASLGVDITERKRAEEALKESEQRFRTLAETTSAAILIYEGDQFVYVNQAALAISGYSPEDAGRLKLWDVIHPADLAMVRSNFEERRRGEPCPSRYEFRLLHKSGETRWVDASPTVIQMGGKTLGLMTAFDVTERKQAEESLKLQTTFFQQLFENSPEGIVILDNEDRIVKANPAFSKLFRYSMDEMKGRTVNELVVPGEMAEEATKLSEKVLHREVITRETYRKRKDGTLVPVSILGYPIMVDERQAGVYGIYRDITERKRSDQRLEYLAHHDTMTGLPNRLFFYEKLRQALAAARGRHMLAVLFIDLDRFKEVNDTLGHDIGDIVLQTVAKRLTQCGRETDVVARMGSDEFTFLLPSLDSARDVEKTVNHINAAFARPFTVASQEFHITTSIGVSLYPSDGEDVDTLMKNADIAMYRAKAQGGNTHEFFAPEMSTLATEKMALKNRLRKALDQSEFRLHYQPKVDSATERILGVEALVRWDHPEMGLVAPGRFMEVAEETGLILPIGEWVLGAACTQARAWHAADLPAVAVAVNLSARQFQQKNLVDVVSRTLRDSGLAPEYLELEITESTAMYDLENTAYMLRRFSDLGIHIAIDDFGKGYSSLAYLKRFPIHSIKIDASFVRDVVTDPDDAAIVKAIITMGHSLKLQVVAEGVETMEQFVFLRAVECDAIQGYFFSRPSAAQEFQALLANQAKTD